MRSCPIAASRGDLNDSLTHANALELLRFGFITHPTKRCLPFQFIAEAIARC